MALVYFASSALVKLVLDESGSGIVAALWNGCDAALSSRLAYPEVCVALAAAARNHDLTTSEASAAAAEWDIFWASMRLVELSIDVERSAGALTALHCFGGVDAVHLASALALGVSQQISPSRSGTGDFTPASSPLDPPPLHAVPSDRVVSWFGLLPSGV